MLAWVRRRDFEFWELGNGTTESPVERLSLGKIRWVDDRWIVVRGLTVRGVLCARIVEFLSYANVGPWAMLALAHGLTLSAQESVPGARLEPLLMVAQRIVDFVRMDHMRQTVEESGAVVGFDVMLVSDLQIIKPRELVRCVPGAPRPRECWTGGVIRLCVGPRVACCRSVGRSEC